MLILGFIIGLLVGFFVLPLVIRKATTCIIQKRAQKMLKECGDLNKIAVDDFVNNLQSFMK